MVSTPTPRREALSNSKSGGVNVSTTTPERITSILLADGWHQVEDCVFTQFAVAQGMSAPQPNKLYQAISYQDSKSNKRVITPLSQILSFEAETY